jgi:hypothetical protein
MPVITCGCCDGTGLNCRRLDCKRYLDALPVARKRKGSPMPTGFGDANPVRHEDVLLVVKEKSAEDKGSR